jgi:hypothetical protein
VGDEEGKVNSETFNGAIINAPFNFLHAEKTSNFKKMVENQIASTSFRSLVID